MFGHHLWLSIVHLIKRIWWRGGREEKGKFDFWYVFMLMLSDLVWHYLSFSLPAHLGRVTAIIFSLSCEWVLSCGRDRYFQWHCSETGRRLGGYQATSWCLCLQYPSESISLFFINTYKKRFTQLCLVWYTDSKLIVYSTYFFLSDYLSKYWARFILLTNCFFSITYLNLYLLLELWINVLIGKMVILNEAWFNSPCNISSGVLIFISEMVDKRTCVLLKTSGVYSYKICLGHVYT